MAMVSFLPFFILVTTYCQDFALLQLIFRLSFIVKFEINANTHMIFYFGNMSSMFLFHHFQIISEERSCETVSYSHIFDFILSKWKGRCLLWWNHSMCDKYECKWVWIFALTSVKYHVRLVTIRVDFNNIPNMIVVRTHIDFGNNNTSIKNEHSILLP